jgi:hypothetical protein
MSIPPQVRTKFYALRAVAVLLLVFAAGTFIVRPHGFGFRLLGLVAILLSVSVVRRSNVSVARARGDVLAEWVSSKPGRVGPLAWILVALSLVACGICVFFVHLDALHGGNETWPAYALFGAVLAVAASTSYVVFRISR